MEYKLKYQEYFGDGTLVKNKLKRQMDTQMIIGIGNGGWWFVLEMLLRGIY